MNRPCIRVILAATASLLASPLLAADQSDRQTETAIPRSGNLYGLGVGFMPKTSGSEDLRTMVLPIIQATYADRFYINALRAGVWLADSDDRRLRVGLAADARFGWKAEDGARTKGMEDRDFSVDLSPALRWQTDYGTLNAQWGFDVGGASALIRGPGLRVNGLVGVTWNDKRANNYYYGVSPAEATASRPMYSASSGTQLQAGVNGAWPVGQRGSVLFGLMATRLGGAQADSPIVETRIQPLAYAGYGWSF